MSKKEKKMDLKNPNRVVKELQRCARCGGNHVDLEAKPFERPVTDALDENIVYTHWMECPKTGDPILVRFQD